MKPTRWNSDGKFIVLLIILVVGTLEGTFAWGRRTNTITDLQDSHHHHHHHHHFPQQNAPFIDTTRPSQDSILSHVKQQIISYIRPQSSFLLLLWAIPYLVGIIAYLQFPQTTHTFRKVMIWASENKWIPLTEEAVALQTSVVTQVINGPVITSISILFATLASMTISTLYQRQMDIRKSYALEVHAPTTYYRCT